MTRNTSVAPFYEPWRVYNERIIEVVRQLSDEELAIRPSPDGWPIWAIVGHAAGARIYWLCDVFGEEGADDTPFGGTGGLGWEDDLEKPRSATELIHAVESTWEVVEGCLRRWTPELLFEDFPAMAGEASQIHNRQGVLVRLLSHDSYHCGELSQTLGIHDLPQIDLWRTD